MHAFGWRRDLPNINKRRYHDLRAPTPIPPAVDLRPKMPPVYDQGQLGSCTANAVGAAVQFEQMRQGHGAFAPSRLFIYWNERSMEGTVESDAGATITDSVKAVNQFGAPIEELWPYDISKFREKPTDVAYFDGKLNQVLQYEAVDQVETTMKACLSEGRPIVVGIGVYESFESADVAHSGVIPMPMPGEKLLGGHAVVVAGYDDATQRWLMRNSWGTSWGIAGYFTLPYPYLTDPDLSSDFWTLRLVS